MTIDPRIYTEFEKRAGFPLAPHLVMAAIVGSSAHGTYVPSGGLDDTDYFLVVMPPLDCVVGLRTWEGLNFIQDELDVTCYSFHKYVRLLIKSNPNVVGTLWLRNSDYLAVTDTFRVLYANRDWFVSKKIFYSFGGYADGQFKKILGGAYQGYMGAQRKELHDELGYDPKNLAHCIRLYRMGIECLQTGRLNVYRKDADELIHIKQGGWGPGASAMARIENVSKQLDQQLKIAFAATKLPDDIQEAEINDFVVSATIAHIVTGLL